MQIKSRCVKKFKIGDGQLFILETQLFVSMKKRVLVTGAGGSAAINFIKSLKMAPEEFYIVGSDINKFYIELSPADRKYILPRATEKNYIDKLNELIHKENIEMLHPQPDIEVKIISDNREKIDAITRLPSKITINICQNKFETNRILKRANIPVPETHIIKSEKDLEKYIPDIQEKYGAKVWLRAIKGAGSRAALPITNIKHAIMWIDYWKTTRGIGYGDFMVAQYLPGKEFAWQSIWDNGVLITSQARERVEYLFGHIMPSGQTSTPSLAVTVHRDDINEIGTHAIESIDPNATGIFCVDMKEDENGMPRITEVNAGRFFTTSNFFSEAGSNMPYYHVKLAFGEEIPNIPKYNPIPAGYYWIRVVDGGHKLIKNNNFESIVL